MRTDGSLGPDYSADRRAVALGAGVQALVGSAVGAALGVGLAFTLTALVGGAVAGVRSANGGDRFMDGAAAATVGAVLAAVGVLGVGAATTVGRSIDAALVSSMVAVGIVLVLLPVVAIVGAVGAVLGPWLLDRSGRILAAVGSGSASGTDADSE